MITVVNNRYLSCDSCHASRTKLTDSLLEMLKNLSLLSRGFIEMPEGDGTWFVMKNTNGEYSFLCDHCVKDILSSYVVENWEYLCCKLECT
jgi:hypothetical protein